MLENDAVSPHLPVGGVPSGIADAGGSLPGMVAPPPPPAPVFVVNDRASGGHIGNSGYERLPIWVRALVLLLLPLTIIIGDALVIDRLADIRKMEGAMPLDVTDTGDYLIIEYDITGTPLAYYKALGDGEARTVIALVSGITFFDEDGRKQILTGGRYQCVQVETAEEWERIETNYLPQLFRPIDAVE